MGPVVSAAGDRGQHFDRAIAALNVVKDSLPRWLAPRCHASPAPSHPDEFARTAEMWLRWTPPEWPLRGEAADLAIGLGRDMLERKRQRAYGAEDRERRVWSAVLAAVTERPEGDEGEFADDLDEDDWASGDCRDSRPGVDRTFATSPAWAASERSRALVSPSRST